MGHTQRNACLGVLCVKAMRTEACCQSTKYTPICQILCAGKTALSTNMDADIGVRGRGQGGGGGNCPPKFGHNSGENLGKARRKKIMCKISGKSTPLPPLTEESHTPMDAEEDFSWMDSIELLLENFPHMRTDSFTTSKCPYVQWNFQMSKSSEKMTWRRSSSSSGTPW